MVLEAHRMAEFVKKLRDMALALVDNETRVEYDPVVRLHDRAVFFQGRLEAAQMLARIVFRIVAFSRIEHAECIDFAILVRIIFRCIELRILLEHREEGPLHQLGFLFPDIALEGFALAHQEHVKVRLEHSGRLVDKVIPHGTQVIVFGIAFLVQSRIHACGIQILPVVRFARHEHDREIEFPGRMMRSGQHGRPRGRQRRHPRCTRLPRFVSGFGDAVPNEILFPVCLEYLVAVESVQESPFSGTALVRTLRLEFRGLAVFTRVIERSLAITDNQEAVIRTRLAVMFIAQILQHERIAAVDENTAGIRIQR